MDEAWCPVCDRLIPPSKIQVYDDVKASSEPAPSAENDSTIKPDDATTTTATQPPPPTNEQRPPTKRSKSKAGAAQLKTSASGKKLAKLANNTAMNPPAAANTSATKGPADTQSASGASSTSKGTSKAKPSKPRTVLQQPASLYCSERCRIADEHNYYTSSAVGGVVYSPSSSYQSASFVAPGLGLSSSAGTTAGPAGIINPAAAPPMASRNSSHSRSRTRSNNMSRRGSAAVINTAVANASLPSGANPSSTSNPYYLASPLLSPTPSFRSAHPQSHSRRTSTYSRQGSDEEDNGNGQGAPIYAYDPDRANGDYFRSLRRGDSQGYFTTPATVVVPRSPTGTNTAQGLNKDGETSSESTGSNPPWDWAGGSAAGGVGEGRKRHTTFGVQNMTSMSSQASSASVSGRTSASRTRKSSTGKSSSTGNGTSAPAYVPTNGYLTHFSGLDIVGGAGYGGTGYPYPYPYPERPHYAGGRSSTSSNSSRRRHHHANATESSAASTSLPRSPILSGGTGASATKPKAVFYPDDRYAYALSSKIPHFALEPHYPGPLSSTSDSEQSGDEMPSSKAIDEASLLRRRRRSDEDKSESAVRPESMTTAPSTESVKGLMASANSSPLNPHDGDAVDLELEKKGLPSSSPMTATTSTPRRPVPSRSRTGAAPASVTKPASLEDRLLHNNLHSKSSASLRAPGSTSTARTVKKKSTSNSTATAASDLGGVSSTAPATPTPLSSFLSTSSSRGRSGSGSKSKTRPEHQHGLLVHVALPSRSSPGAHTRSHSLGFAGVGMSSLGASMLAPSLSTVRANGTLASSGPTPAEFALSLKGSSASSGITVTAPATSKAASPAALGSALNGLLDLHAQLPIEDALPPRNDARSSRQSRSLSATRTFAPEYAYGAGVRSGDPDVPRGIGWPTLVNDPATVPTAAKGMNPRHTRSPSLTPAQSYRTNARLQSLMEGDGDAEESVLPLPNTAAPDANNGPTQLFGGNANPGAVVDLETYVPTYPMEHLPGNGDRRKRLFYFGGY